MAKTGIIGHRGAAGLALENSRDSMLAALKLNVDAIEFDIHRTLDDRLVVLHDAHTGRIADKKVYAGQATLAELRTLRLKNGQQILTLEEVLDILGGKKPVVIDIKDAGCVDQLLALLAARPGVQASFTSLLTEELGKLHRARPDLTVCVRDLRNPFRILKKARSIGADAMSLNKLLINPITYRLARSRGLEVRIYNVNGPLAARFFRTLYPDVVLYSNRPERVLEAVRVRKAA